MPCSIWERETVSSCQDSRSVRLARIGWFTVWEPISTSPESAISRNSLHEHGAYFGGGSFGTETPISTAILSILAFRSSGRILLSVSNKPSILSGASSLFGNGCSLNHRTLSVHSQSTRWINELTTKRVAGMPNCFRRGKKDS